MKFRLLFFSFILVLAGCKNQKETSKELPIPEEEKESASIDKEHHAQNSLDWPGLYYGLLPCGDENCEGIASSVQLNTDNTYEYTAIHWNEERSKRSETGTFQWDERDKSIISLTGDIEKQIHYWVQENALLQIGNNKEKIQNELTNRFRLKKVPSFAKALLGNKWRLTNLYGVEPIIETDKTAYLAFGAEQVNGSGGCNGFFGSYTVMKGNRIRFGEMASSEMFCVPAHVDDDLMKALSETDNWVISKEGELRLQTGKRAAHAIFQAY